MRDVNAFLSQLTEARRGDQAAPDGFVMLVELPADLELAIERRSFIVPIQACSNFALHRPGNFVPSCSRKQIEYWYAQHLKANRILETGVQSQVISLEIQPIMSGWRSYIWCTVTIRGGARFDLLTGANGRSYLVAPQFCAPLARGI